MKNPCMLIVSLAMCAAPAFAMLETNVDKVPFPTVDKAASSVSAGLLIAQAQAPGRPVTADEAKSPAPQTPVRDRVAPTVPPPPPRNTPEPRRGGVNGVKG
jgi:hypothetical protein